MADRMEKDLPLANIDRMAANRRRFRTHLPSFDYISHYRVGNGVGLPRVVNPQMIHRFSSMFIGFATGWLYESPVFPIMAVRSRFSSGQSPL